MRCGRGHDRVHEETGNTVWRLNSDLRHGVPFSDRRLGGVLSRRRALSGTEVTAGKSARTPAWVFVRGTLVISAGKTTCRLSPTQVLRALVSAA